MSVEDQRFYDHSGVDAIRDRRRRAAQPRRQAGARRGRQHDHAAARAAELPHSRQDLPAQAEGGHPRGPDRESSTARSEILELYLNKVYFGDGLYGVEAASRGYFASSATRPERGRGGAAGRAHSVAVELRADREPGSRRRAPRRGPAGDGGVGRDRSGDRRSRAKRPRSARRTRSRSRRRPASTSRSRSAGSWSSVSAGSASTRADCESRRRSTRSAGGGREDRREGACRTIEQRRGYAYKPRARDGDASRVEGRSRTPDYLQGALVAIDPETGHVRALVGGRDFGESRFNRAAQAKRQSGLGVQAVRVRRRARGRATRRRRVITGLDEPILTAQGEWVPEDEHSTAGSMTLRTALRTSSNRAAVQLLQHGRHSARPSSYAEKLNVGDAAERARRWRSAPATSRCCR